MARADLQPFGTLLERECGLDLGRDVIELDLALAPDLRPEGSTLFMRGRFTPASIHRCIGAVWRATGQGTLVSETHGRMSELVSDSGRRMYIGWPTADTMALNMRAVAGDRSVLGWLEESPAPVHRTLVGASRLLAPGSCIGLLALVTGKTAEGFPRAILHLRPDLLWLNLHHEAGMTAELGFRFASERLAREFRDGTMREIQAAAEHPAIARLVSSLSVSVAGPELRFVLSLDEAELEAAFDELVARYPGLRGGPTP